MIQVPNAYPDPYADAMRAQIAAMRAAGDTETADALQPLLDALSKRVPFEVVQIAAGFAASPEAHTDDEIVKMSFALYRRLHATVGNEIMSRADLEDRPIALMLERVRPEQDPEPVRKYTVPAGGGVLETEPFRLDPGWYRFTAEVS